MEPTYPMDDLERTWLALAVQMKLLATGLVAWCPSTGRSGGRLSYPAPSADLWGGYTRAARA